MVKEMLVESGRMPPYPAYGTFKKILTDMAGSTVPGRLDSTYWGQHMSGSVQAALNGAFKFFGFVDDTKQTQPKLKEIVQAMREGSEHFQQAMRDLVFDAYSGATSRVEDLDSATLGQLNDAFRDAYAVSGGVLRKTVTFFIHALSDVGIGLSPHIAKKTRGAGQSLRPRSAGPRARRRRGSPTIADRSEGPTHPPSLAELLLNKLPDFDPDWSDQAKQKWFDALREFKELLKDTAGPSSKKVQTCEETSA